MGSVDVGGKGEATIDIDELKDEESNLEVAVGDRLQAVVVSTYGGLTLSRKLARGAATLRYQSLYHHAFPAPPQGVPPNQENPGN